MIAWFEVPVLKMDRAKAFYEEILEIYIALHEFGGLNMGWFPNTSKGNETKGCLIQHEKYVPSLTDGVLIYFSCDDVADVLTRTEKAGGRILQQKTEIGDGHGFMAILIDTEGNRIALHSNK